MQQYYVADSARLLHDAALAFGVGRVHVDVGSGFSPLAALLRLAGAAEAHMVDRFDYPVDLLHGAEPSRLRRSIEQLGVQTHALDVAEQALPFADASVDSVTCLAVVEHLHHSPAHMITEIRRVLRPGGIFVCSAPNAVNIRKRFSVLLGRTNLPSMRDFFEAPRWYGHVHEPTVSELRWLLEHCGFRAVRTFGRNFIGAGNYGILARGLDPILRMRPGLCSDLYAIGTA